MKKFNHIDVQNMLDNMYVKSIPMYLVESITIEYHSGKIKTVLHHNLNNLRKDLKTHVDATMTDKWYTEKESDCKTCVFNINNNAGSYSNVKNNDNIINDCAMNNNFIDDEDLRLEWTAKTIICPYYRAAEEYRQNMSGEEIFKFKEELKNTTTQIHEN